MNSKTIKMFSLAAMFGASAVLTGCSSTFKDYDGSIMTPLMPEFQEAQLSARTSTYVDLLSLPKPKGRIVASVYRFKDFTGQYRPQPDNGFSTAVSQGTHTMLIEALSDSGWFIPIEREGLQHVLTERKFKRSIDTRPNALSPMLSAQIVLEGGVISYESASQSGGTGARFLGIGGAEQYEMDQVTVSLRAVNVDNGEILNNVTVTKSILSKEIQAGIFRYVDYKQLLEVDSGITTNEPVDMAVRAAIEAAVVHMIVDGIEQRHWTLSIADEFNHPVIQRYAKAKPKLISYRPKKDVSQTPTPQTEFEPTLMQHEWDDEFVKRNVQPTSAVATAKPSVKVINSVAVAKAPIQAATTAAIKPPITKPAVQAAKVEEPGILQRFGQFVMSLIGMDSDVMQAAVEQQDKQTIIDAAPSFKPSVTVGRLSPRQRVELVENSARPEVKLDSLEYLLNTDQMSGGSLFVISQNRFPGRNSQPMTTPQMREQIRVLRQQVAVEEKKRSALQTRIREQIQQSAYSLQHREPLPVYQLQER